MLMRSFAAGAIAVLLIGAGGQLRADCVADVRHVETRRVDDNEFLLKFRVKADNCSDQGCDGDFTFEIDGHNTTPPNRGATQGGRSTLNFRISPTSHITEVTTNFIFGNHLDPDPGHWVVDMVTITETHCHSDDGAAPTRLQAEGSAVTR